MMAYAHDITKRNIASLETDLGNATQELEIRNLELQRAKYIQSRLQLRIEDMERVFKLKMAEALAQYEEAQTALITSQNKISTLESKQVIKLKVSLDSWSPLFPFLLRLLSMLTYLKPHRLTFRLLKRRVVLLKMPSPNPKVICASSRTCINVFH